MVSRSLEKMLLIAVGLTMCVMVGVPVLLVSMDAISNASQLESAQSFANTVHNITSEVDTGQTNDTSIEIRVPEGVSIRAEGSQLIVEYEKVGTEPVSWDESYTHTLDVVPPTTTGLYLMRVRLVGNEIVITFTTLA
ncbi:MAG: hypothetical protein ACTSUO_09440 [Candidatus Thorarchaeota archaeon]